MYDASHVFTVYGSSIGTWGPFLPINYPSLFFELEEYAAAAEIV